MIDGMSDGENLSGNTLLNSLHAFLGTLQGVVAESVHDALSGRS